MMTLKSCGNSSSEVLRMNRPTGVTRGSSRVTSLAAPASLWFTYIERNLKTSISSLLKP